MYPRTTLLIAAALLFSLPGLIRAAAAPYFPLVQTLSLSNPPPSPTHIPVIDNFPFDGDHDKPPKGKPYHVDYSGDGNGDSHKRKRRVQTTDNHTQPNDDHTLQAQNATLNLTTPSNDSHAPHLAPRHPPKDSYKYWDWLIEEEAKRAYEQQQKLHHLSMVKQKHLRGISCSGRGFLGWAACPGKGHSVIERMVSMIVGGGKYMYDPEKREMFWDDTWRGINNNLYYPNGARIACIDEHSFMSHVKGIMKSDSFCMWVEDRTWGGITAKALKYHLLTLHKFCPKKNCGHMELPLDNGKLIIEPTESYYCQPFGPKRLEGCCHGLCKSGIYFANGKEENVVVLDQDGNPVVWDPAHVPGADLGNITHDWPGNLEDWFCRKDEGDSMGWCDKQKDYFHGRVDGVGK